MKMLFVVVLFALVVFLNGCPTIPSWHLDRSSPNDIVPTYGEYKFTTDQDISDPAHLAFRFNVLKDSATQKPVLEFSSDSFRFDRISISRGAFYREWGEIGGTHVPTDSYALSGHFTAPDKAEGVVKLAYDGQIVAEANFEATLALPIIYPE